MKRERDKDVEKGIGYVVLVATSAAWRCREDVIGRGFGSERKRERMERRERMEKRGTE